MKIAFMYYSLFEEGGAEKVITLLANYFIKKGHEVFVFTLGKTKETKYRLDDNVHLFNIDVKELKKLTKVFTIRNYIKQYNIDVLFAFSYEIAFWAGVSLLFTRTSIIGAERSGTFWKSISFLNKFKVFGAGLTNRGYVFLTNRGKKEYPSFFQNKSVVIPNPVAEINCPHDSNNKRKTVISVGRLIESKDFDTLILAFNLFQKNHPDYDLIILGEGPSEHHLCELIESLNLPNKVKLLGHQDNVHKYLSRSEMFVLTSKSEGMPNALIEAMSSGLPCIATDCLFGPSELIINGINGFLEKTGDYEGIAKRMSLIADNKELAHELADKAKLIVETNSLDIIGDSYMKYAVKCSKRNKLKSVLISLLLNHEWGVAYRTINDKNILTDTDTPFKRIKNTFAYYFADPMLFQHNGEMYLFVEAFKRSEGIGKIGCFKYSKQDQKFTDFSVIIDEPFHMSYPFIFTHNEKICIIPETRKANAIYIYEAVEFPHKWKRKLLINDISTVDSTIYKADEHIYLTTYTLKEQKNYLSIYELNLSDYSLEIKASLEDCDINKRPAGSFFIHDGKLFRPSQLFKHHYGEAVILNEVHALDPYKESLYKTIYASDVKLDTISGARVRGIHTYNKCRDIDCIDAEYQARCIFFKKLYHIFKKYINPSND